MNLKRWLVKDLENPDIVVRIIYSSHSKLKDRIKLLEQLIKKIREKK